MIFKVLSHSLRFSPARCGGPWVNPMILNQECMFTNTARLNMRSRRTPASKPINNKVRHGTGMSSEGGHSRKNPLSNIWKPLFFTVSFTGGTIALCTIWQIENRKTLFSKFRKKIWEHAPLKPEDQNTIGEVLRYYWYDKLTDTGRLFYKVLAANLIVYLGWRIPEMRNFMVAYFTTNSAKPRCWSMVLSTFSHYNLLHLIVNMTAFYSFIGVGMRSLGKEDFIALYFTSGVVSSFVSLLHRMIVGSTSLSVGASGAIMGVVAYVAAKEPNLQFSFLIPALSLPASAALKLLMAVDFLGVCLKWRLIDHASHLGGVCWGLYWYYRGENYFWGSKDVLLAWWSSVFPYRK